MLTIQQFIATTGPQTLPENTVGLLDWDYMTLLESLCRQRH